MKKIIMTLTLALGAMIAIPAAANAQSTTTTTQTKECCKDKKECKKDGEKSCAKADGKACCKDGKGGKGDRKREGGKFSKGDRKVKGPKDSRMGKRNRKGGENPMMKGITLSEEQQTKVRDLQNKNREAMKASKADAKAKSKTEMQKLRADFDKEMEKILDKDQLKQYKANKAEMDAKRAEKEDGKKTK